MDITRPTKIMLDGGRSVTLRPVDFIASGGEGAVYRVNNRVIKLYADPDKMKRDHMSEKIKLLSAIKHPFIVAPESVASSERGDPLGYAMPFITGEALPRLFTNDWRTQNQFGDKETVTLVHHMRDAVSAAHAHKALLVDGNELNWLMTRGKSGEPEPRAIDVDAWCIDRFKASVIMPSIRDWNAHEFTQETDWFSWAIVTFQLFTGIHPYKGTLPGFTGNFIERMKERKSVFEPSVRLPKAVRDFSGIPPVLLDWYIATFKENERTLPPSPFDKKQVARAAQTLRVVVTQGKETLRMERLLAAYDNPITRVFACGVAVRKNGDAIEVATARIIARYVTNDAAIVRIEGGFAIANIGDHGIIVRFVNSTSLAESAGLLPLHAHGVHASCDRLLAITDNGITEVGVTGGASVIATARKTWTLSARSLSWHRGVGVHNALGSKFLVLPFIGSSGQTALHIVRVPTLDAYNIIDGVGGPSSAVFIALDRDGSYKRITCTFNATTLELHDEVTNADGPEMDTIILSRGVAVRVVADGTIEASVPATGITRVIQDHRISSSMQLFELAGGLAVIDDGALWRMSLS